MTKKVDDAPPPAPGYAETAPIAEDRAAATRTRLVHGERVAGRYGILRYVARGGMGEVYEAEDLELGERIALKTIRGEPGDRGAEERFKREIQLSRKVTHPNVCRIFDVGYHVRPDGERVVFLTMELLLGETLTERVRRTGPLPIAEAATFLRQITAALTAAHAVGVIHRDLKGGNVLLVSRRDGAVRAVVTDFGLAHVVDGGDELPASSSGGAGVLGTPGYMAPEQVQGGAIDERTDIYALGVVMFEMLTGRLPFEGDTPLAIAARRLTTPAPSPKALRPELSAKWERVVLACLERDPSGRPASSRAVLELLGLTHDSLEEIDGTVRVAKEPRRVPLMRPALVLLVAALALLGVRLWRERPRPGQRRALATLPFRPEGARAQAEDWIGPSAAELIAVQLGGSQVLQSFDTESVQLALREAGVAPDAEATPAQVERLRSLMALDLVISGRYRFDGDRLVVEAGLRDVHTRRRLAEVTERGGVDDLSAMFGRIAQRLGAAAGAPPEEVGRGIPLTLPKRPLALRALVETKNLLDRHEAQSATEAALRGLTEEPEDARLHLLLAEAYADTGNEAEAQRHAKKAEAAAAPLPRLERIFVEAVARSIARDRDAAIAKYEILRSEAPNDPEVAWRLVDELTRAGRATDALRQIEALRRAPLSRTLALRIDDTEADAWEGQGDLEHALAVTRRAVDAADALGAALWRARARFKQCHVLDSMHRFDEARAACEETRRIAVEAGERRLRGLAVNLISKIDHARGDLAAARRGYEETLQLFHDLGDRSGEAMVLNNLGAVASSELDRDRAARMWRAALAITDELQDDVDGAPTRENLSEYAYERLEWDQAIAYATAAQRVWRSAEEPAELADATCRLAALYLETGRGRDAERQLDELDALLARLSSAPPGSYNCDLLRADAEAGRGRIDRAVAILRSAVDRVRHAREDLVKVPMGYALANALADSGDAAGARNVLAGLGEKAGARSDDSILAAARILQLRLDGTRGARDAAQLRELEATVAAEGGARTALALAIELERARARVGGRSLALRRLREISADALRRGAVSLGLEAQLHEIELRAEDGARPSRAAVVDYARRARAAGRPGWADRVERLADAPRR